MAAAEPDQPLRILHLEDSDADHALACIALRRAGMAFAIERVDTLDDFARLARGRRFDVILADYRLPGFTALDAWALLQGVDGHPPLILLSGAIGEAAAVDAMRLGFADYLLKDDIGRLARVVRRALEVHEARRAREESAAALALSQQRLAALAEHLQTSIEQERAAIAREIHDDIGGSLAAVRIDLAWIGRHTTADAALQQHVASASEMLQHAIGASQRIMMDLRPPILDQGLVAAVQWLAQGFERRTGVPATVRTGTERIDAPAAVQLAAYRTAQEALTNIAKHARCSRVRIDVADSEGLLTLEIADDGQGLARADIDKPQAFGLRGLYERARTAGGWLDVSSQPGRGTSIVLSVPLRARAAGALP